jgi:PAS domain S-box-containing protein
MTLCALVRSLNRQRASQAAGWATVAIAIPAFIGWWVPLLSGRGSAFATVKPVTALCLVALGLALVHPGKNSLLALAVGLAVAAIATLDLLDRLGLDFGINRLNILLVPWAAVPGPETAFRMINGVPVALALGGISLALSRFERYHFAATVLAVSAAGVMQVFALLQYLSGARTIYGSLGTPTPLTVVGLLCVIIGIILRIVAMPALRRPRPLWHLLIMLGCAIIAPPLMSGVITGTRITDTQLREVHKELMSEARIVSANVDREIIGEIERLQALAASASLGQGDFAEFQRQAEASLAWRQSGYIVLIDGSMQEFVHTGVPFGRHLEKAAVPEAFVAKSLATGKPQVTGLFIGAVTKQLMFTIIVPVQIDGTNRYVLARPPDLHAFAGRIGASELPQGWQAVVFDPAHRIIARSGRQDGLIGQELPREQWPSAGAGGVSAFLDSEGRPSLQAHVRSELTGWETAVWAPKALLQAPVRALWWNIGLTALTAFAPVVLASWLGWLIARSVGHAAHAATTLGEGGPPPSRETPVAEVDTLMAQLRKSAARRQATEDFLHDSEVRFRAMFEVSSVGKVEVELGTGRYLRANAAMCTLVGYSEAELLAMTVWDITHPDEREREREAMRRVIAGELSVYDAEKRYIRKDGTPVWVQMTANIIRDESGRPLRSMAVIQDITERKEHAEKEHLLMREMSHRAKNTLSVVDAIAHQTASRSPEDFIARFSDRIHALSASQDLLVRNNWRGVEIKDLVHAQLAHFADLIGSRIATDGPKLRVNEACAQAIGLALHELATNAGKYGALSTDTGRVDVVWGTDGDTFAMSWTERDGPPVSAPKRRGFGTIVMGAMTERSVDGKVDIDYSPSGLTWRLSCPTVGALESQEREQISREKETEPVAPLAKSNVRPTQFGATASGPHLPT